MSYDRKPLEKPSYHNNALRSRTSVLGPSAATAPPRTVRASKGARELARKRGLDLAEIKGTGDNGSVTVEDVRRASGGV